MTLDHAAPAPTPPARPRRRAAAVAGVVGVSAVIGAGAWGWQFWNAQGPQAAEALPASTLAYLAVDLDPPGGQKVAAFNALSKLPTLRKELDLGDKDDLRDALVDEVTADSGCDIDPRAVLAWAGDRAALAVVPVDVPEVVAVVQVADAAKAEDRLEEIARDCGDDEFGYVVGEKWAILAETNQIARQVANDAKGRTLAEDGDFQELTGAAGDGGVMTAFLAPESGQALLDAIDEHPYIAYSVLPLLSGSDPMATIVGFSQLVGAFGFADGSVLLDEEMTDEEMTGEVIADEELTDEELAEEQAQYLASLSPEERRLHERLEDYEELTPAEQDALMEEMDAFYEQKYEDDDLEEDWDEGWEDVELPAELRKDIEAFSGLGGVVRFDDGMLEIETISDPSLGGLDGRYDGDGGIAAIEALPADTAIAFGGQLADGWGQKTVLDGSAAFSFGETPDEKKVLAAFEKSTGLTVQDLEAIGGDTVAFAARPGFEDELTDLFELEGVPDIPVAARVTGDADLVEAALRKLNQGKDDPFFQSRRDGDSAVVIGPDVTYLEELVDPERTLGDSEAFERALPDADDALVAIYADLGAGSWLKEFSEDELTDSDGDALGTAGISVTRDGERYRTLMRITLD